MCRIAGIFDPGSQTLATDIVRMRDAMRHGGPDDEGIYLDPAQPLALGHRRLSLIDLSAAGHQPMADLGGNLQLVFNGEIYNFRELRSTLEGHGHAFSSHSDTEVILKAYQQWGTACFERFNGMFALALYDRRAHRIVLARDHAGIKPLYYWLEKGQLYFASEIRAFHAVTRRFEENPHWKVFFLAFGHLPEPVTTLDRVRPLPKGHWMTIDLPELSAVVRPFCQFRFTDEIRSAKEAVPLIREALNGAVERHLISDAPIGLFLSGGIDSSSLALLARPVVGDNLRTLSIVFEDAQFSEKPFQDLLVGKLGGHHSSYLVTAAEFNRRVPDALHAMDQPTTDGINSYFISLYAHENGLKAVLAGHGADELFGGYPTFRQARSYRWLRRTPAGLLRLFDHAPGDKLRKLAFAARRDAVGEYLTYRGFFTPRAIARMLVMSQREVESRLAELTVPGWVAGLEDGNRASYIETSYYLQNQLLRDTDAMSMWHSLEIRVPFLDRNLMELLCRISSTVKFDNPVTKHLLIDAMGEQLPEAIWNRPKQGFTFPFAQWMLRSQITEPTGPLEETLFREFSSGRLTWARYWCALLACRFRQFVPAAAA